MNSTTASKSIAIPDLAVVDGQITTTSTQVSEHFQKRHDTVLRAIRNLECTDGYRLRNFAETSLVVAQPNGGTRSIPAYRMTRDGFVFLAMGFTGKEAALWKEAYIDAFNRMEKELMEASACPPGQYRVLNDTLSRLEQQVDHQPTELFMPLVNAVMRKTSGTSAPFVDLNNAESMKKARMVADEYLENYRTAIKSGKGRMDIAAPAPEVLQSLLAEAVMHQRMMVSFDCGTGRMNTRLVPEDASVVSFTSGNYFDIAQSIPMDRLPEMLGEINKRVAGHLGAFKERLNSDRKKPIGAPHQMAVGHAQSA